mmetsp:Transcript_1658/g.4186  ORF Transcript_1658/g.4186 Transcript_1658/m.4186 type:complete len:336 (+) Transcript_1658:2604-3611(+)
MRGTDLPRPFQVRHHVAGERGRSGAANVHDDAESKGHGVAVEPALLGMSICRELVLPFIVDIIFHAVATIVIRMQLRQYAFQVGQILHQIAIMKKHVLQATSVSKEFFQIHPARTFVHHGHAVGGEAMDDVWIGRLHPRKPRVRTGVDGVNTFLVTPPLRLFIPRPSLGFVLVRDEITGRYGREAFPSRDSCERSVGINYFSSGIDRNLITVALDGNLRRTGSSGGASFDDVVFRIQSNIVQAIKELVAFESFIRIRASMIRIFFGRIMVVKGYLLLFVKRGLSLWSLLRMSLFPSLCRRTTVSIIYLECIDFPFVGYLAGIDFFPASIDARIQR